MGVLPGSGSTGSGGHTLAGNSGRLWTCPEFERVASGLARRGTRIPEVAKAVQPTGRSLRGIPHLPPAARTQPGAASRGGEQEAGRPVEAAARRRRPQALKP
jgi:hypothetical protein